VKRLCTAASVDVCNQQQHARGDGRKNIDVRRHVQSNFKEERRRQHRRLKRLLRRMRRRLNLLEEKKRNMVKDFHYKVANDICDHVDLMLLPKFGTSQMVKRFNPVTGQGRKIKANVARLMLDWRHYQFRQIIQHVAARRRKEVRLVNEHYTTQQCDHCGHLHTKIGGSKVFLCPNAKCRQRADRDHHSARAIMLKAMTESSISGVTPFWQ
jgi:putative transposase